MFVGPCFRLLVYNVTFMEATWGVSWRKRVKCWICPQSGITRYWWRLCKGCVICALTIIYHWYILYIGRLMYALVHRTCDVIDGHKRALCCGVLASFALFSAVTSTRLVCDSVQGTVHPHSYPYCVEKVFSSSRVLSSLTWASHCSMSDLVPTELFPLTLYPTLNNS